MSPTTTTELRGEVKPAVERREILGPAGNRVRVMEEQKKKKDGLKKPERAKKPAAETPKPGPAVRSTGSADRSASSDSSSCGGSTLKKFNSKGRVTGNVNKPAKVVPDGAVAMPAMAPVPLKRCDWITPNTEPRYVCFHDEEWGVPVHDDVKLFELLVLSQALAELTWPVILEKRDALRRLFNSFDPLYVANLDEKKLIANGNRLLSEPKLRAIVENAKQLLKIQSEFGSFSNYCWHFVNHQPLRGKFQYARHIPAKTPKSEFISKDLMRRGFCCVGPTVVYSFMQAAGLVNDHLITCFRYNECSNTIVKSKAMLEKVVVQGEPEEKTCTPKQSVNI